MLRSTCLLFFTAVLLMLSGCGDKDTTAYSGKEYSPTTKIATAFHYTQVPRQCRVFAEALAVLPPNLSGNEVQRTLYREAGAKGADLILVGQTRQGEEEDLQFIYYGPKQEYSCAEGWNGWRYGYDLWAEQGEWVNIGHSEWGDKQVTFATPLIMQVAFMRCR